MLNKIKENVELLAAFPLGITQAYCKKAQEAASKALAAADKPESLEYIYNIFDLREKVRSAMRFCSSEPIVHNSEVVYPLELLKNTDEQIENLFSESQQTDNNN